jgi:hypothetical protein
MEISGSMFIHNAIKQDYCIEAVAASFADLCEEVIILDAESDDGTVDLLYDIAKKHNNVKIHTGAKWACERPGMGGYDRYAVLADKARALTRHQIHFMIQADEVLHEDSIPIIQNALINDPRTSYAIARYNIFGSPDTYLRFDSNQLTGHEQPCNVWPTRLGNRELGALGDAESIGHGNRPGHLPMDACLFHYCHVRDPRKQLDRVMDVQSWFFSKTGGGSEVDKRILEQKATTGYFDARAWYPDDRCFIPIPKPHPKYALPWVEERRRQFKEIFGGGIV